MAGPGMHQTQNLSLQQVLAPQLQQSLLILQAPLLELRNLVQQEMETNPVLEELADAPNPDAPTESETPPADDNFKEEFDKLAKLDEEWRDYMAQSSSYSGRSQEAEEKRQFFFDSIPTQETLQQHLMGQLNQNALDADDRKTAELIIGNIDDNGFLQTTPEEMALNTGIPQEDFEHMLTLIQSFHPPGVGAGDLRECLYRRKSKRHLPCHLKWRTDPASAHQQHLQRHHGAGPQRKRSEGLHSRQDPERKIFDQIDSPAPADNFQHCARDRETAAGLLRQGIGVFETDDNGSDRGRGRRA